MPCDVSLIITDDFKNKFFRGFDYIPTYDETTVYNTNDIVFYQEKFYKCIVDNTTAILPTDINNWEITTGNKQDYILNEDIENAFIEAQANFNQSLYTKEEFCENAYLYLTAHYLVNDIRNGTGLNSTGGLMSTSRSVGSVSESYTIPAWMQNNPLLSFYTTTYYGVKYINLTRSQAIGRMGIVFGKTTA